jgi:hypothetical protein
MSLGHSPLKQIQSEQIEEEIKESENVHLRNGLTSKVGKKAPNYQDLQNSQAGPNRHILGFSSPSSIKVIDLKQPNVRRLLMDSLQEIVKERKNIMHQKESKLFNHNYDQIIKHTMQNRVLNVEKSVPAPPN